MIRLSRFKAPNLWPGIGIGAGALVIRNAGALPLIADLGATIAAVVIIGVCFIAEYEAVK